jgi:hypothetical protein
LEVSLKVPHLIHVPSNISELLRNELNYPTLNMLPIKSWQLNLRLGDSPNLHSYKLYQTRKFIWVRHVKSWSRFRRNQMNVGISFMNLLFRLLCSLKRMLSSRILSIYYSFVSTVAFRMVSCMQRWKLVPLAAISDINLIYR